jgi:hypothetical protein
MYIYVTVSYHSGDLQDQGPWVLGQDVLTVTVTVIYKSYIRIESYSSNLERESTESINQHCVSIPFNWETKARPHSVYIERKGYDAIVEAGDWRHCAAAAFLVPMGNDNKMQGTRYPKTYCWLARPKRRRCPFPSDYIHGCTRYNR